MDNFSERRRDRIVRLIPPRVVSFFLRIYLTFQELSKMEDKRSLWQILFCSLFFAKNETFKAKK
jgi:hypothetical protein